MSIITPGHVHSRNWMKCPQCEGQPLTEHQLKLGMRCDCINGEVPRFKAKRVVDNSSYYEKLAGA